jgi:hypothetical protein
VPEPVGLVIKSGEKVPCDGIWEPVAVEQSKLMGVVPIGGRVFRNRGCFNYFVAEVVAPSFADIDVDTFDVTLRSTHWRLLWEDTRYRDGIVPDESQYFLTREEEANR